MKKNILIIGSNSDIAKSLIFNSKCNYIKLSSKNSNFNILDTSTFPEVKNIDGLVYFPGSINLKPFNNLTLKDFKRDYEINAIGLINIIQFYYKKFNPNSSLVFISSIAAKIGLKFHSSISMSKAAIEGLARTLASEFSPNIRVNCVCPSIIETKLSSRLLRNETNRENIMNDHPLKRIGQTEDISNMIEFLISDKASWITGQNIHIDGGLSTTKL